MKRRWTTILTIALPLIFVAIWYFYAPEDVKGQSVECPDITKGCGIDGWQLSFDRQPQMIKPFGVVANLPDAKEAYIRFAMRGMEMGFNRYKLLPRADGLWTAEVILPVCVKGRADWVMELDIKTTDERAYLIPFKSY